MSRLSDQELNKLFTTIRDKVADGTDITRADLFEFCKLDIDGDGLDGHSSTEIRVALNAVQKWLDNTDSNNDDKISLDEFKTSMNSYL